MKVVGLQGLLVGLLVQGSPFAAATGKDDKSKPLTVHVVVALCDNRHQGIVPVKPRLGNGDDPDNNLYWGALYGVRTFFRRAPGWTLVQTERPGSGVILERILLRGELPGKTVYLLADAYRGSRIREAMEAFLGMAAGRVQVEIERGGERFDFGAGAGLVAFVGHNGLMDLQLEELPGWREGSGRRDAVILACKSRDYFEKPLREAGANPLVWSTGLMAAEAYTLLAAVEGWARGEQPESVRERAARAYARYQKCSIEAARRLLVTGPE